MTNKILKIVFIILGLIVLLSVPLALWLKQETTKDSIKNFIVNSLNESSNFHFEIDEIELSLPLIIKVKKATLSEKGTKFAELDNLYVNIIPSIFFLWKINIWEIAAEKVTLSYIPSFAKKQNDTRAKSAKHIPTLLLHNINLKEVVLSKEATKLANTIHLNVASTMQINFAKQNIDLQLTIQDNLNGIKLTADTDFNLTQQVFNLYSLKVKSSYLTLNTVTKIDIPTNIANGTIEYFSDHLGNTPNLQGNMSGKIDFAGDLKEIIVKLDHNVKATYLDSPLPELNIISEAKIWPSDSKKLKGTINYQLGKIMGTGEYFLQDGLFDLILPGKNKNITKLHYDYLANKFTSEINIINQSFLDFEEGTNIIQGGSFDFKSKFLLDSDTANLTLSSIIKGLKSSIFALEKAEIQFNSNDLLKLKCSNSKLLIANFNADNLNLTKAIVNFHSDGNKLVLSTQIGTNSPFRSLIKAENYLTYQDGQTNLVMNKLEGEINKTKINLSNPFKFSTHDQTNIANTKILMGNGYIDFGGTIKSDSINMNASFKDVPSQLLQGTFSEEFDKAKLGGKISLTGTRELPMLNGYFTISGFHVAKSSNQGIFDIKFKNDLDTNNIQKLVLAGHIFNSNQKLVDLSIILPISFSSLPWNFRLLANDPFEAKLKTMQSINMLSYVNMPTGHKLGGEINGYVNLNGTLNNPQINANLEVTNGKYSYKAIGIKTKNITGRIKTTNNKIIFNDFIIGDYFGNLMSGQGHYDVNNNGNFDFRFSSNKFNLLSNPVVQGQVQGDIHIFGNNQLGEAKGKVVLGPLDIKIPERLNSNIPTINVTKVIDKNEDIYRPAQSNPYRLKLDIQASTNNQVFVSGRGVKTKLQGDLHVIGSAQNPEITGKLVSVHGKYQDFGRQLEIRQGEIIFDGPIPPSPYLNITGVAKEGAYEVHLNLTGSIIDPKIDISSIPALNQEEAMSILLFGENPDNISALQAFQLANSMSKLSGGKSIDPLKAIPLDDISIKNDKKNPDNTVIGMGKYLTDKVYFEVEQNTQDSNTKTKVEVEMSPKISIEGSTESTGNSSMGINWRFDY